MSGGNLTVAVLALLCGASLGMDRMVVKPDGAVRADKNGEDAVHSKMMSRSERRSLDVLPSGDVQLHDSDAAEEEQEEWSIASIPIAGEEQEPAKLLDQALQKKGTPAPGPVEAVLAKKGKEFFKDEATIILKGPNRDKWCYDRSGVDIRCNAGPVGTNARFVVEGVEGSSQYALKSGTTGKYCADEPSRIRCNRDALASWEKFRVYTAGGAGKISLKGGRGNKYCRDTDSKIICDQDNNSADNTKFIVERVMQTEASAKGNSLFEFEDQNPATPKLSRKTFVKIYVNADKDQKGFVTKEDIQQFLRDDLASADTNGDGKLSKAEEHVFLSNEGVPPEDEDKIESVSFDELPAIAEAMFEESDADGDGKLVEDEAREYEKANEAPEPGPEEETADALDDEAE